MPTNAKQAKILALNCAKAKKPQQAKSYQLTLNQSISNQIPVPTQTQTNNAQPKN